MTFVTADSPTISPQPTTPLKASELFVVIAVTARIPLNRHQCAPCPLLLDER